MRMLVVGETAARPEEELYAAGFTADVVQDSRLAVWLAHAYRLIVIVDQTISAPAAIAFCRRIRNAGNTVPILALPVTTDATVALLDAGADDCLAQPVVTAELAARIRALLRRARG